MSVRLGEHRYGEFDIRVLKLTSYYREPKRKIHSLEDRFEAAVRRADSVLETMADPRYLRVLGNPLLVVYRPELLLMSPSGGPAELMSSVVQIGAAIVGITALAAGLSGQAGATAFPTGNPAGDR